MAISPCRPCISSSSSSTYIFSSSRAHPRHRHRRTCCTYEQRARSVSADLARSHLQPTPSCKDQPAATMPASGSTQALVPPEPATTHRGGGGEEAAEHRHCLRLLQRMAPADRRLTRLLVNVTVDRSLWPVHLVLAADATVADLVRAAVAAYVREGRRPPLQPAADGGGGDAADGFELHFSKYSLESLRPEEKVLDLGSRNFFLCARRSAAAA